ncbi:MAG: pilus assembly protein [Anaerolineae bacterium]|nr:pilus assembly protein [Anaerolineae bacterium]
MGTSDAQDTAQVRGGWRNLERGQSLVEVSIGFVILVIIVSGLLDLGRAYFIHIALEDGAGEAALYLSINPGCRTAADGDDCADPNNAEYRALNAGGAQVDWPAATINIERPDPYGVGDPVSVSITYPFHLISPFVPRFAGINPIYLGVNASQVIIGE